MQYLYMYVLFDIEILDVDKSLALASWRLNKLAYYINSFFRFCNAPSAAEMIMKIINTAESKLQEISCSPSVKQYEAFIRKNLKTLHLKHYLNLLGKEFRYLIVYVTLTLIFL